MRKIITFTLALLALTTFANGRNDHDVVLHNGGGNNGNNQIYIEPPYVTYDEVDATGDVHLGEGFIVENGATFAIKTPGRVTIDGCVFQGGARVKIEAGKVEVVGKFTAERGSKVEFTQFVEE